VFFFFQLPPKRVNFYSGVLIPIRTDWCLPPTAGVQPKAQLISNPTRVVIDLPGISWDAQRQISRVRGAIREIRVGQLDNKTTRIVIELAPAYTLDPQQVKFRGLSPRVSGRCNYLHPNPIRAIP
jgi:N-acetylmuramoyl-L-alanine amidase